MALCKYGDGAAPNSTRQNLYTVELLGSLTDLLMPLNQRSLVASLSSMLSSICKKAFLMSAVNATLCVLTLSSTVCNSCIRLGPVWRGSR